MFLKDLQTGALVKITQVEDLANPVRSQVKGRLQAGEEEQPPTNFDKAKLSFPSGESLPQCWLNADYRFEQSNS
ncbi:hypothetical protein [Acaryochloris sp. CCMEE 5410]|uniref:hypothetical protein n=1 Tax=Acaryochloris sp. CCMEE 5410 TaxID=310037 RepID=UPI0002484CB9|nr:hypothetical protein [Acaryochloris sp. CCMEE 5410]KAI9132318.1 acetyltransferase [Acaryochloris sp. CCMEE 5410]